MCFFCKQKTAYEMRISDWSSGVCSSDLEGKQFRSQADAEEYLFDRLRNYRFSVKKVADRQYAISRRAPRITSISGGLSAFASRHRPIDLNMAEIRQGTINGSVTDTMGAPLPGVAVVVKGTTLGTSTDEQGAFSLQADENDVLVFSMVGFTTREVPVTMGEEMNIQLRKDAQQLEEVVVVGYGSQKKAVVSGAVAGVEDGKRVVEGKGV